ncbi:transketolase [Breznakiella homolactica]|uniref:Transketolase n=1 Tax=Breznakiella homolactica TaxID=2798577 RepID=A0A7T7XRE4_9SPIR|nr:transketolase [Breznakiella homolactica]QQO11047.1 transketolase [Breznakiella homolactica]
MTIYEKKELDLLAAKIRLQSIISMASYGSGHAGGVLSLAEAMAVLYGKVMHYDSANPQMEDRDRLVLSKGHCGPVLYAVLALEGFFPLEMLKTLNANGGNLPSHSNMHKTPGVDISTGSLGQGSSLAAGIALGMRLRDIQRFTYLILGDGECDEGQVWEAALFAAQRGLGNLIGFVDWNHQQLDGYTDGICGLGDLERKFMDFGWDSRTIPGHDVEAVYDAVVSAQAVKDKPSMIILDTVKGKGWSLTEGKPNVHHITISPEQLTEAENEIGTVIRNLEKETAAARQGNL